MNDPADADPRTGPSVPRRTFLASTAAATAGFTIVPRHVLGQGQTPPSEKVNIASIGAGGRAAADIQDVTRDRGTRMVALCDVDLRPKRRNAPVTAQFPEAKVYQDFRKMFDEIGDKIDAVIVGTPDHTHAVAAMAAIKRNKPVYCEKPLAHSVAEVRARPTCLPGQGGSHRKVRMRPEGNEAGESSLNPPAPDQVRRVFRFSLPPDVRLSLDHRSGLDRPQRGQEV